MGMSLVSMHRVALLSALLLSALHPVTASCRSDCDRTTLAAVSTPATTVVRCLQDAAIRERLTVAAYARIEGAIYGRGMTHPQPADVPAMQAILLELDRRHATGASDLDLQESVLLQQGRFAEASILARRNPTADTIPVINGKHAAGTEAAPRAWQVNESGALEEQAFDLTHGVKIVVNASPECEFCLPAARWLEASSDLGPTFRAHAIWVSRPGLADLHLADYSVWDREHPSMPMRLITDPKGWPMPDSWSTPRFVVLKEGHRVAEVMGWTAHTPEALRAALTRAGLALGPHPGDSPVPTPFDPYPPGDPDHERSQAQLRAKRLDEEVHLTMAPIRARADLDAYLHAHPITETPFAPLSPASRERFFDALVFDPNGGLISSPFRDIDAELTYSQAYRLLALFGREGDLPSLHHLRVESVNDRLLREWVQVSNP